MIKVKINDEGMKSVLRQLALHTMKPASEVVTAEAGSILQRAHDLTRTTPARNIEEGVNKSFHNFSESGKWGKRSKGELPKVSVAPRKGHTWLLRNPESTEFASRATRSPVMVLISANGDLLDKRLTAKDYGDYQNITRARDDRQSVETKEKLQRRPLPKQSWYLLAEKAGVSIKTTRAVISATVRGKSVDDAATTAVKEESGSKFNIHFSNQFTSTMKKNGADNLERAISGRLGYFKKNLEKGVFNAWENVARAYPRICKAKKE